MVGLLMVSSNCRIPTLARPLAHCRLKVPELRTLRVPLFTSRAPTDLLPLPSTDIVPLVRIRPVSVPFVHVEELSVDGSLTARFAPIAIDPLTVIRRIEALVVIDGAAPAGTHTASEAVGTRAGCQFPAVAQSLLIEPDHVIVASEQESGQLIDATSADIGVADAGVPASMLPMAAAVPVNIISATTWLPRRDRNLRSRRASADTIFARRPSAMFID